MTTLKELRERFGKKPLASEVISKAEDKKPKTIGENPELFTLIKVPLVFERKTAEAFIKSGWSGEPLLVNNARVNDATPFEPETLKIDLAKGGRELLGVKIKSDREIALEPSPKSLAVSSSASRAHWKAFHDKLGCSGCHHANDDTLYKGGCCRNPSGMHQEKGKGKCLDRVPKAPKG